MVEGSLEPPSFFFNCAYLAPLYSFVPHDLYFTTSIDFIGTAQNVKPQTLCRFIIHIKERKHPILQLPLNHVIIRRIWRFLSNLQVTFHPIIACMYCTNCRRYLFHFTIFVIVRVTIKSCYDTKNLAFSLQLTE